MVASAAVKRGGRSEWSLGWSRLDGKTAGLSGHAVWASHPRGVQALSIKEWELQPLTARCRTKEQPIGSLLAHATLTPVGRADAVHHSISIQAHQPQTAPSNQAPKVNNAIVAFVRTI